jgi:hypothetical protein
MAPLSSSSTFAGAIGWVISLINLVLPVLTLFALVLFMYSGYRYVAKAGDSGGKGHEREALFWGIIALFVIVSVWGLVRFMCATLLGNASCH